MTTRWNAFWLRHGQVVLWFLAYSMLGWAYEVFLEVVVYRWGFSDRGVLLGPYCPVYGFGALAFLLCLRKLTRSSRPLWTRLILAFLGCMAVATALELATSYLLEWLTGGWPWQTYVNYAIHFQGRIALSPSVRFGLGGVVFLFLVQPLMERATGALPERWRILLPQAVAVWLLADLAVTLVLKS